MSVPTVGSMIWEGNYSVRNDTTYRYGNKLNYFEYNWNTPENERTVVFSDLAIPTAALPRFSQVTHKVAWLMEGPGVYASYGLFKEVLTWLLNHLHLFSAVATCDDELVARYPDKMVFVPLGVILVPKEHSKIYAKSKLCSMVAGRLYYPRDIIYNHYNTSDKIEFLGKGVNKPFNQIVDAFKDYRYHVSVPSCANNRFFSSTITDAFACGTVPIWWGCDKIGEFFNDRGLIVVRSMEELDDALNVMSEADYLSRMDAIVENHARVERYRATENVLWENILSKLM